MGGSEILRKKNVIFDNFSKNDPILPPAWGRAQNIPKLDFLGHTDPPIDYSGLGLPLSAAVATKKWSKIEPNVQNLEKTSTFGILEVAARVACPE